MPTSAAARTSTRTSRRTTGRTTRRGLTLVYGSLVHESPGERAEPCITRVGRGARVRYVDARGRPVRDARTLDRIRRLAIPPAWTDVRIAADARAHVQATGRDARGRKQYRYHPEWQKERDQRKYERLVEFCGALPALRRRVREDLRCRCLCKRKVVATIVALMERAQLRVGNDAYTRSNGSYGATTLRDHHARLQGRHLVLAFRGKGGVQRRVEVDDRRLVRIVRRCRDLPGQRLFQYVDGGTVRAIGSSHVNGYLREATGGHFTSKDFRTWAATLSAAMLLATAEPPTSQRGALRATKQAIATVAARLGHTIAVCRSSYIHPRVLEDFQNGELARRLGPRIASAVRSVLAAPAATEIAALRAVEPVVARYLAGGRGPRRARA